MLINTPPCMSTLVRAGAFIIFLLTCSWYFLPQKFEAAPTFRALHPTTTNLTETGSTFNASIVDFWQDLASALLKAKPQCDPLQIKDEHVHYSVASFDPIDTDRKPPERLVNFTDEHETALLRAHYAMRTSAQRLAGRVPFLPETTGIVTTANAEYLPVLLVSLRMLRRTGCKLPVEVYIDDWPAYDASTCEIVLPSLDAHCIILSEIYGHNRTLSTPEHYQYKILAILFSKFQNLLFLDSDTFPVYDPTVLFTVPPFTTHSLVTWPDYSALTTSPHFHHIAGISPEPVSARLSTDSGQLMLNKHIHRESLLMMVYYNYFGPEYFYPLLCQGSHGACDKETFVQAARAVSAPWYQVRTAPVSLGRWWNGTFRGVGIAQADAGLDYDYLAPVQSHIHVAAQWQKQDTAHPNAEVEKKLNITRHVPRAPRPVFVHQNTLKMDPGKVLLDTFDVTFAPEGTKQRMWGIHEDTERILGYDVETRLWDVVAEEACRVDQQSEKCKRVRAYVEEVFGWMESKPRPW
jgi:alpha 1,2-mannosyltransferase